MPATPLNVAYIVDPHGSPPPPPRPRPPERIQWGAGGSTTQLSPIYLPSLTGSLAEAWGGGVAGGEGRWVQHYTTLSLPCYKYHLSRGPWPRHGEGGWQGERGDGYSTTLHSPSPVINIISHGVPGRGMGGGWQGERGDGYSTTLHSPSPVINIISHGVPGRGMGRGGGRGRGEMGTALHYTLPPLL